MLIDTNIFLELFLNQEKMDRCKLFLNKTLNGEINAFVSDFSIDSILLVMGRNNIQKEKMRTFLINLLNSKGISIYSVGMKDRINALHFMEAYNFDYEDSVILQSALACKCKEIVSFDKHFDRIKEVKRIEP